MYLTLVFLPLYASIGAGFFSFLIGSNGACVLTTCTLGTCFILSCIVFYEVALQGCPCYVSLFSWFDCDLFSLDWGFQFDTLTAVMLLVVTFISFLVHFYSCEYMVNDAHQARFMSYLSLFTFFMLILISADNFLQMFVGWEGVGLCSYLLINFWFTRLQANKAAIKAILVNRVGDFGLALAIFSIYVNFGCLDYSTVFECVPHYIDYEFFFFFTHFNLLNVLGLFLFLGAVGKSAQLGLHTWLPDAMEGPTPVSALIHAATMVTAGVFLLARCSPILEYADYALCIFVILGGATAFFAGTTGLLQNDIKKLIAYSTCSQLGYMIFACGLSSYHIGVFHLANHAFFKALLFLGAGCVIHAIGEEQDMRKMGGLSTVLPFTYACMLVASLSLIGFPFLTAFYSKDLLLEVAYAKYSVIAHSAYVLGTMTALCSAFYSVRLLFLTFLSKPNGYRFLLLNAKEASLKMSLPLFVLAIPSILIGYVSKDMMVGFGTNFWQGSVFIHPKNYTFFEAEYIPTEIKLLPTILSTCTFVLFFILYLKRASILYAMKISNVGLKLYTFFNKKWFFDKIYNETFGQFFLNSAYKLTYKKIDRGVVEFFGPHGLGFLVSKTGYTLKLIQSGFFYHYTLSIILSLGIFFLLARYEKLQTFFLIDSKMIFLYLLTFFFCVNLGEKTTK